MLTNKSLICLIAVSSAASARAEFYHLTDLGVLSGWNYSRGVDINASGEIVGYGGNDNGDHAFRYTNGTMTQIDPPHGANFYAQAVNSAGQIVIWDLVGDSYLYSGGQFQKLGSLGGGATQAMDINDSGQIVGSSLGSHGYDAFIDTNGVFTDIGALGGSISQANGVNSSGVAVGFADTANNTFGLAFRYSGGTMTSLGTLGGNWSDAYAINDAGEIVGNAAVSANDMFGDAFIYSNGKMTDIGPGRAYDVNAAGQVVGGSVGGGGFVYANGVTTSLNSLLDSSGAGYSVTYALSINNEGDICGYAAAPDGSVHAIELTPVPEPASFVAIAVPAFWMAKRRKARASSSTRVTRCRAY